MDDTMPRTDDLAVLMAGVAAREHYTRQIRRLAPIVRENPSDYETRGICTLLMRAITDEARLTIALIESLERGA